MLLIFLALLWLALLAPVVVRKVREYRGERSIEHFHVEHEVLSRQGYAVEPAHRLDDGQYAAAPAPPPAERRPRLTLVHPEDTYRTLEARSSWDEWSEDYDFDRDERVTDGRPGAVRGVASANHYARAYSTVPTEAPAARYEPPLRRRSMRAQRRRVSLSLLGSAVVLTAAAFLVSASIVADLAYVAWLLVVAYVALALYAVSQGYMASPLAARLPVRRPESASLAYAEAVSGAGASAAEDDWDEWDEDEWADLPPASASYGGRRAFG